MAWVEVTDPKELMEAEMLRAVKNSSIPLLNQNKSNSALKTLGKSAVSAIPSAIANLGEKTGILSPETANKITPYSEDVEFQRGREKHPIASFAGEMVGFLPLGVGTGAAIRGAGMSNLMRSAGTSALKRNALLGAEGAIIGGMYAPPGHTGEGALMGAAALPLGIAGFHASKLLPKKLTSTQGALNRVSSAEAAHIEQQNITKQIQRELTEQGIPQKPETIRAKINQSLAKQEELKPTAGIPEEKTHYYLPHPETENFHPLEPAKKAVQDIEREISYTLNQGKSSNIDIAPLINEAHKNRVEYAQKKFYNPVENYNKKNHITISGGVNYEAANAEMESILNDLKDKHLLGELDAANLRDELLNKHMNKKNVPANDILKLWQDTKDKAWLANSKGYKQGGHDQMYWREKAAALDKLSNTYFGLLEANLPEEMINRLLQGTEYWGSHIASLYGHPYFEAAKVTGRKPGKLPKTTNIMEGTSGHGRTHKAMRGLILESPEMTRMALGHTFAENPQGLLNALPHEREFINSMPRLPEMLEKYRHHKFNEKIAEAHHAAKTQKENALHEATMKTIKEQERRKAAITEIQNLDKQINKLEKEYKRLKEAAEKGEATQKELEIQKAKLEAAEKKKGKLKSALSLLATVTGMKSAVNVIKHISHILEPGK